MAAAIARPGSHGRRDDVFLTVFPPVNFTTPTPEATPNIGSLSPERSFGGFSTTNDLAADTLRYNRSWSEATRYLSLHIGRNDASNATTDTTNAFAFLLESTSHRRDLLAWYENEISVHFRQVVGSSLQEWSNPVLMSKARSILQHTIHQLQVTRNQYLDKLEELLGKTALSSRRGLIQDFAFQVQLRFNVLVSTSLPRQRLQKTLASVLYQQIKGALAQSEANGSCTKDGDCHCSLSLGDLPIANLYNVGLGGATGERAFAYAVHKLLAGPAIERRCFDVDWTGHKSIVAKLQRWIERHLIPFVEHTLALLNAKSSMRLAPNDSRQFLSEAIANLGRQRTDALFEYVNYWPDSQGAMLDIKEYLDRGQPEDKARVCSAFSTQISQRLLHSGASTTEILSIYINVIHAFRLLDSRGVLLEKVATPIRNYLRGRDDTVHIIAESLLAEDRENDGSGKADADKVCLDIPREVTRSAIEGHQESGLLNWNDLEWMPDPIDAGPDYKASKSEDVVAYILGLFEQDDFISEVRNVLARHLLEAKGTNYDKETRLVELLKARLDGTKLQAVEVMLKDVRDSVSINKRINPAATFNENTIPTPQEVRTAIPQDGITLQALYQKFEKRVKQAQFYAILNTVAMKRQDMVFPKRTRLRLEQPQRSGSGSIPDFRVQIVSKNFWPDMATDDFAVPASLLQAQQVFERNFAEQGGQRKLHFRPSWARITVDLELEDRHVKEEDIQIWKASVIDVFAQESTEGLTVEQIAEAIEMDEELVTTAVHFWLGKRVLYQPSQGVYAVLERLDMDTGTSQEPEPIDEDLTSVRTQQTAFQASAPMFGAFITNMLQNTGAKEIGGMMGITNMLKMVNPAFVYGDDEVRWLLGEMERKGEVLRDGDLWRMKPK